MVFRGKPSKACERCRTRRLKCDFQPNSCSSCIRAKVACSGYRDTQKLRIHNESQALIRKALNDLSSFKPRSLALSVESQAKNAFFGYYVTGVSNCWNFLGQFYHPLDSTDHLTIAIEAVSLAYLWHQVYSETALRIARQRYITALRLTNEALRSPVEVTKHTTLVASLILDLFEKIINCTPRHNPSWTSHVNGALALVKLRGLENFQNSVELRSLVRLTNHYIASCITSSSDVPDELLAIQSYITRQLGRTEHTLSLSALMVEYSNLLCGIRMGILPEHEQIIMSLALEKKLQKVDIDMPTAWQSFATFVEAKSDRTFDLYCHIYPHRNICHARNLLRVGRILLNEALIEHYSTDCTNPEFLALSKTARDNIEMIAGEICASAPQYTDCDGLARKKLPFGSRTGRAKHNHSHTVEHQADCYSIIFALYAAGRSQAPKVRPWVIDQLHYIGSHFYIRHAEITAGILERGEDICPWEVYAMLGSYAFSA